MPVYTLSPSDLTFQWEGCKRCFVLKVKHNLVYRGPFPGMFGKMGDLTSNYYLGRHSHDISPDLPEGRVQFREKWVKSVPIDFPGTDSRCVIRGRLDAVVAFEDGSYAVIDYKTSEPSPEHVEFYGRQLSAYAYALENPAPGAFSISPISRLGLFIVTPARYELVPSGELAFITRTTWMDVPRDDFRFLDFLSEVVSLLDQPALPESAEDCGLCQYRRDLHEAGIPEN
jgi:hypothetical protein